MSSDVTLVVALAVGLAAGGALLVVSSIRRLLDARLGAADAELRRLADAAAYRDRGSEEIRREVSSFREAVDAMRVREQERREREDQAWAVLHRVASVLAGSQRAGRAGENVLHESLSQLPPAMLVRDLRVNGRVVEFALVLPDGRRLPIDSKWPAERELLALASEADPQERDRLVRAIERAVTERAREVSAYLDPALTAPLAVAAVPDAAYAVLRRAHAEAYRRAVIVIPYSMALPVLLFLHALVARLGSVGDVEGCIAELAAVLDALETTVENKVAKAATMLQNGADELRGQMGKARATLSRARAGAPAPEILEADPLRLDHIPS